MFRVQLTLAVLGVTSWLPGVPAVAQQQTASLTGFIRDSASGDPLDGVRIEIEDTETFSFTDAQGAFRIGPMELGVHTITILAEDFRPKSFRFEITPEFLREVDIGILALSRIPTYTIIVEGALRDVNTQRPVAGATVIVNGDYQTRSGKDGTFRVVADTVIEGNSTLVARMIGYESTTYPFRVGADSQLVNVELALLPLPTQLDEIIVEGRAVRVPPKLNAFFQRRDNLNGHFLTPWEIEANPTPRVSDLLGMISAVRVRPNSMGGNDVRLGRMCDAPPHLFIDGLRIRQGTIDELLRWQDLSAVEVYVGASSAPPEFNVRGRGCGVIVFWTKQ